MTASCRRLRGNIEYGLSQEPVALDVRNCKNYLRQAGAPFIPFVAVPLSKLSVSGSPKNFMDTDTVSGNCVARHFCGDCSSPIYVMVAGASDTAYVASGKLDVTDHLQPKCNGWTSKCHSCVSLTGGAPQEEMDSGLQPEVV